MIHTSTRHLLLTPKARCVRPRNREGLSSIVNAYSPSFVPSLDYNAHDSNFPSSAFRKMGCTSSTAKEGKDRAFTDIGPASTVSASSSKAVERLRNKGNAEFAKQKFDTAISLYSDALGIDATDYR